MSYVDLPSPAHIRKLCDCGHDGCWHAAYVRHYERMFSPLPPPRRGWEPQPAPEPPQKTKKEMQERERELKMLAPIWDLVSKRRAAEWWAAFDARYRGVPARLMSVPWLCWRGGGSGGGGGEPESPSWALVVRAYEDWDDGTETA